MNALEPAKICPTSVPLALQNEQGATSFRRSCVVHSIEPDRRLSKAKGGGLPKKPPAPSATARKASAAFRPLDEEQHGHTEVSPDATGRRRPPPVRRRSPRP